MSSAIDTTLVSLSDPDSFTAEQYQGLRLKVEELRKSKDFRVFAISSPGEGEGKTLTAINLAGALARGGVSRVLLVDADLRHPRISDVLGIDAGSRGFADAITDDRLTLQQVTIKGAGFNFDVVPAGSLSAPVHDVLRSARLASLLEVARREYDYVVLDTPPLLPVFDSALLSRSVDGMLIVVAAHRTRKKLLEQSLNLLDPAKVAGIIFNRDDHSFSSRYEGRYHKYFRRKPAPVAA
jgi:capsular exopolysaccharide synthesis family protein